MAMEIIITIDGNDPEAQGYILDYIEYADRFEELVTEAVMARYPEADLGVARKPRHYGGRNPVVFTDDGLGEYLIRDVILEICDAAWEQVHEEQGPVALAAVNQ